jgi:DNA polymerase-3 subunit gamma/tau
VAGLVADPSAIIDASPEELAEAKALAARAPRGLLGALFDRWARAVEEAGKSQSPRLIFEMAICDLCFTEPLLPLGDLLQRLEELEGRLGPGGGTAPPPSRPPTRGPAPVTKPSAAPAAATPTSTAPVAPPAASVSASPQEVTAPPAPVQAAAAPPPPVVVTGLPEAWRRVRDSFGESPILAALDHAEVAEWEAGRVTLVLPDKILLEKLERSRKEIERVLQTVVGVPTTMFLRQGVSKVSSALRSEVGREADATLADQRKREAEARQHPMIKKAQELFGVGVREIKTP